MLWLTKYFFHLQHICLVSLPSARQFVEPFWSGINMQHSLTKVSLGGICWPDAKADFYFAVGSLMALRP